MSLPTITLTYVYDASKKKQECPNPDRRPYQADLLALAKLYIANPPSERVVENKDFLTRYVCKALNIDLQVNWGRCSEEDLARVTLFQNYCDLLFDTVQPFILEKLK